MSNETGKQVAVPPDLTEADKHTSVRDAYRAGFQAMFDILMEHDSEVGTEIAFDWNWPIPEIAGFRGWVPAEGHFYAHREPPRPAHVPADWVFEPYSNATGGAGWRAARPETPAPEGEGGEKSTRPKLTPALRSMLMRVGSLGPLLELAVTASGGGEGRKLRRLIEAGWVERVPHPTVMDRRTGEPAAALVVTEGGRDVLSKS